MPDYDPKSIPILDDIIEDEKKEPELDSSDIAAIDSEGESEQPDDNLDLFSAAAKGLEAETAGPELGTIDQLSDSAEGTEKGEEVLLESARIDYHSEEIDDITVSLREKVAHFEEAGQDAMQSTDETTIYDATQNESTIDNDDILPEAVQPVVLESLVDDIVRQLMPDLEQQLRFLVEKALQEKLPAEILEQNSADESD
jgi:hypothetical protein